MHVTLAASTSIEGEKGVLFAAGVIGLSAIFLALLKVVADKREWPYAWHLGIAAVLLASLAGALGFWEISGDSGLIFLLLSVGLAGAIWLGLALSLGRREQSVKQNRDFDCDSGQHQDADQQQRHERPHTDSP
jgi:hypothetical protein